MGVGEEFFGCRYIHSIYDMNKKEFRHFDGAIRMYDEIKILKRWETTINKAGKDSEYSKLFRIDGNLLLADWKKLAILYYHGNPLIYEYFGVKEDFEELHNTKFEPTTFQQVMPYFIEKKEGLKLFVSYHPALESYDGFDRIVTNLDVVSWDNGERQSALEYDILEIKKILLREGEKLNFPDNVVYIKPYDFYTNYPTILHGSENTSELLKKTVQAYKLLFELQAARFDKIISFSLAWPMGDREVRLSVFGNISEIVKWLELNSEIPIERGDLKIWIKQQNKWLSENYEYYESNLFDIVKSDGIQYIKRRVINQNWIKNSHEESGKLKFDLEIPESEQDIHKEMTQGNIYPTYSAILKKVTCSSTGEDYFKSSTSKFLDNDVQMLIEEADLMGYFWTDRKYF